MNGEYTKGRADAGSDRCKDAMVCVSRGTISIALIWVVIGTPAALAGDATIASLRSTL